VSDPRLEVESATSRRPWSANNAWSGDRILVEAVKREAVAGSLTRASRMGDLVGSERMQTLAMQGTVTRRS